MARALIFSPAWAILISTQSITRLTLLSIRRLAGGVKPGRQDGIMFMESTTDRIRPAALVVAITALLVLPATTLAQSGTWTNTNSGLWSDANNWGAGIVADGTNNAADFSTIDITDDVTVHLDTPRTIGSLVFGDTATIRQRVGLWMTMETPPISLPSLAARLDHRQRPRSGQERDDQRAGRCRGRKYRHSYCAVGPGHLRRRHNFRGKRIMR